MSKRHWFRFWMANYLEGVRGMSDELVATYTKIFVKMYDVEGPLRFDDQQLKLLLGKRPQDCRRIVNQLVELGKLSIDGDGFIHNGKADDELASNGQVTNREPKNDGSFPGSSPGKMTPHFNGHGGKKNNENLARAHDHARGYAHPRPEEETETSPKGAVSSPYPPTSPAAPSHGLEGRSVDKPVPPVQQLTGPFVPASRPRERGWDESPTPIGQPPGQTKFLKKYAAYQAGDRDALKPTTGAPLLRSLEQIDDDVLKRSNEKFAPKEPLVSQARLDELAQPQQQAQPEEKQHGSDDPRPDDQPAAPDDDEEIRKLFGF